jgi:hemolysin III
MSKLREPVSGLTHLVGLVLSVVGLCALLHTSVSHGEPWHIVSFSVFGTSLILLYGASTLYHLLPLSKQAVSTLRRIDHMMIYVLIAGSYTPLALIPLRGAWGWGLLIPVWGIAVIGIILTAKARSAPRWISTAAYLLMGWMGIVTLRPLLQTMPSRGLVWLLTGGLLYTVGAIFYGLKWPRLKPGVFGFHELWHLFVMGGSLSHYWMVFRYISALP